VIEPSEVPQLRRNPVDDETLRQAGEIVDDVRDRGEAAVLEHGIRLGDIEEGEPMVLDDAALQRALSSIPSEQREVLERAEKQIATFARAQLDSVQALDVPIPGGRAGHDVAPVARAGCYAPGGRFPLPSSVLMTAVTARVAGVDEVWVASPRPAPVTLAAAAIAGVDGFLAVGGAQAIAAMAYGAGGVPACDAVVGPGNRWVTAAKKLVSGQVRIDMLAGPSELVVLADDIADPETVAADLLAQAEHDPDALPVLVSLSADLVDAVNAVLPRQLADLSTRDTAGAALENGFAVVVGSVAEGCEICNRLAPEHLEVLLERQDEARERLNHFGGLFVGHGTAEVFGDYGAGPNHTLPTGGTARSAAGLSVFTFLRIRTWMEIDELADAQRLARDSALLARMEGLEAHARSAEKRLHDDEN
jgi:phosphoribosyl-ATP pyrophosphohydrolase/phosphoribosyl-AMP cyclohydrolase/histidinol dehydrogenase